MTTDVAALEGQIEANRGKGQVFDYGFTTLSDSENINDFLRKFIDTVCFACRLKAADIWLQTYPSRDAPLGVSFFVIVELPADLC